MLNRNANPNQHKKVPTSGKVSRKPGAKTDHEVSMVAANVKKPITIVICPKGNTVCCQIDRDKKTLSLLSGKIMKGQKPISVAYKIGFKKTTGVKNVTYSHSEIFEDRVTDNTLDVNVMFAEPSLSDAPKDDEIDDEIWVPIYVIENQENYNGLKIRPLTKHVITESVKLGKLKRNA